MPWDPQDMSCWNLPYLVLESEHQIPDSDDVMFRVLGQPCCFSSLDGRYTARLTESDVALAGSWVMPTALSSQVQEGNFPDRSLVTVSDLLGDDEFIWGDGDPDTQIPIDSGIRWMPFSENESLTARKFAMISHVAAPGKKPSVVPSFLGFHSRGVHYRSNPFWLLCAIHLGIMVEMIPLDTTNEDLVNFIPTSVNNVGSIPYWFFNQMWDEALAHGKAAVVIAKYNELAVRLHELWEHCRDLSSLGDLFDDNGVLNVEYPFQSFTLSNFIPVLDNEPRPGIFARVENFFQRMTRKFVVGTGLRSGNNLVRDTLDQGFSHLPSRVRWVPRVAALPVAGFLNLGNAFFLRRYDTYFEGQGLWQGIYAAYQERRREWLASQPFYIRWWIKSKDFITSVGKFFRRSNPV